MDLHLLTGKAEERAVEKKIGYLFDWGIEEQKEAAAAAKEKAEEQMVRGRPEEEKKVKERKLKKQNFRHSFHEAEADEADQAARETEALLASLNMGGDVEPEEETPSKKKKKKKPSRKK